ncbi:FxSxx-COOH cyclophane-containing RiPP peptide [Dactylosporangium sp. NPDC000521]|uniref:FxSxx-COOH cyclophane-containing RiPP peptide n=1 Tax=Dactylosporangium sp. NPDC000521 TaxID=3363975 RepID=UPI003686BFCE
MGRPLVELGERSLAELLSCGGDTALGHVLRTLVGDLDADRLTISAFESSV